MIECKEYGLKCLKCPYWNPYSNYCTKYKIWSETHMTAKRFTLFDDGETIFDNETVAEGGGKRTYWIVEYVQVVKLVELLNELAEENKQLKAQLLYDGDDVCGICKHEYLVPSGDYFIGKCKKGHKECSKKDIKYCENFELIQVDFDDLIKRIDKELEE